MPGLERAADLSGHGSEGGVVAKLGSPRVVERDFNICHNAARSARHHKHSAGQKDSLGYRVGDEKGGEMPVLEQLQ